MIGASVDYFLKAHYGPEYANDIIGMLLFGGIAFAYIWRRVHPSYGMIGFLLLNAIYCFVSSGVCLWFGSINGDLDVVIWHTINVLYGAGLALWSTSQYRQRREIEKHPVYIITQLEQKRRLHR